MQNWGFHSTPLQLGVKQKKQKTQEGLDQGNVKRSYSQGKGRKWNIRARRLGFHQKLYLSKFSQGGRRKLVIIFYM